MALFQDVHFQEQNRTSTIAWLDPLVIFRRYSSGYCLDHRRNAAGLSDDAHLAARIVVSSTTHQLYILITRARQIFLFDVIGSEAILCKMSNGVDKHLVPFNRKNGPMRGPTTDTKIKLTKWEWE